MATTNPDNPVREAIKATRGLAVRIAGEFGIKREAVYAWDRVPAERVLGVEKVTGISRHILRPDIYPLTRRKVRK